MSSWEIWLAAGLAVGAAEMIAPGFYLLWIGLAAVGTSVAAALGLGWPAQLAAFAVLAIALVGLAYLGLRRRGELPDNVNAPTAGLIGAPCYALAFQAGEGRVSLNGGTWPARIADAASPAPGEALRVVGLDGTTVLVTRA